MNEEDYNYFRNLIQENKLEELAEILRQKLPNDNSIILIIRSLNALKLNKIKGLLTNNEEEVEVCKICNSLLYFIDNHRKIEISNSDLTNEIFVVRTPTDFNFLNFIITFICIGLFSLMGYCFYKFPPTSFDFNIFGSNEAEKGEINTSKNIPLKQISASSPFFEERKIKGADKKGKIAEYIVFLVRNFNWRIGEIALSEKNGKLNDICSQLKEIGVASRVNRDDLKGIVCFGNTSYEESSTIPEEERLKLEEERADKRAQKLAECVSNVLIQSTPIFTSNIGKYKIDDEISAYQRSIILIGIIKNEMNVVNEEALLNAFQKEFISGNWELNLNLFSKVENDRIEIHKYFN